MSAGKDFCYLPFWPKVSTVSLSFRRYLCFIAHTQTGHCGNLLWTHASWKTGLPWIRHNSLPLTVSYKPGRHQRDTTTRASRAHWLIIICGLGMIVNYRHMEVQLWKIASDTWNANIAVAVSNCDLADSWREKSERTSMMAVIFRHQQGKWSSIALFVCQEFLNRYKAVHPKLQLSKDC